MVRTPLKKKAPSSLLRKDYSLRSGKTGCRVSARNSMFSSNISRGKKPKNAPIHSQPSHDAVSECEEQVLPSHEEEEEQVEQEVEEATVSEAATIVVKPSDHPPTFGKDVQGRILEEVIESFIVKRGRDCPRIPLCRLMENEAIRAVGPGTETLVARFEKSGYSVLSAPFIIAFKKPGHDQQYVSENDVQEWGPIWEDINKEFEANLPPEWDDLRGKKFPVYDGNHRLKIWGSLIKTQYSMVKWRHCSVKCQFVDINRHSQAEFMLALRTQNEIGRTTVCTNYGQEVFLFQKLAMASKESLLKDFPKDWLHWIEVELACERKGAKGTWYNAPAVLLAMLVWKEEFDATLAKELVDINDPSISMRDKEIMARGKTEKIYKERAYKMLSIANPANGQGFFSLLYKYNWVKDKDMVGLTKDKVHSIATAKICADRKRDILHSILNCRLDDPTCERYLSAQKLRLYLRKEWYWENLLKQCLKIKGKLVDELPEGFETWFSNQRRDHLDNAFSEIWSRMNTKESDDKIPELVESSKRVFYRWIVRLHDEHSLEDMPTFIDEWIDLSREGCMYPPWLKDRGLGEWEVEYCPWWIDYPIGEYPRHEADHYKEYAHKREMDETDEVGSASKKPTSSKRSLSLQKKGANIEEGSHSAMSSIKKRLEFMEDRAPKKLFKKPSKSAKEDKGKDEPSDDILKKGDTLIAATLTSVLENTLEDEARFADFLRKANVPELFLSGEESNTVASLLFADFPTGCLVEKMSMDVVPAWNEFSHRLSKKVATLASLFVADNGWYITLCSTDHFGIICGHAAIAGFKLKQTILLLIPQGYMRKGTLERVEVLLLGMFYRKGNRPIYDRQDGETVDKKAFDAQSGILVERDDADLLGQGVLRGPAERSLDFYRWLVLTFTMERTAVIDIFAGCGGLGVVCAERHRHCLCVDYDRAVFDRHLGHFGDIALTPLDVNAKNPNYPDEDTDWEQYEPPT